MMRLVSITLLAIFVASFSSFGQFIVTATNNSYTVKVNFSNAVVVDKVNHGGPGYNYKIRMNFEVIVTGAAPHNEMYDLRGVVRGPQGNVSFNLPKSRVSNSGFVITGNGNYNGNHNGNIQDVMNSIEMVFQWNEIPYQTQVISVNPLPVELLKFEATPNGNQVDLSWITASERDNDFFTIEKTIDGSNYEAVATVAASGNSSTLKAYAYTDYNPSSGTSYYRLKQTDFNGVFETFEPKAVIVQKMNVLSNVFPNPAVDSKVTVTVAQTESLVNINLYGMAGQVIYSHVIDASSGNVAHELQLPETGNVFFIELVQENQLIGRHHVLAT